MPKNEEQKEKQGKAEKPESAEETSDDSVDSPDADDAAIDDTAAVSDEAESVEQDAEGAAEEGIDDLDSSMQSLDQMLEEGPQDQEPFVDAQSVEFEEFEDPEQRFSDHSNLDIILDVDLNITVELGRTSMAIKEILNLLPGSVIELNKLSGEPVDILVNGKLMARGEVVVVDDNFGVKISSICSAVERIKNLRS